ncbi:hypothetical protein C8R46DRAFT_1027089 [Mycena filopes]|nr:hypothetical protein C8R46DRAFT_1027089 [Mycena filopes]
MSVLLGSSFLSQPYTSMANIGLSTTTDVRKTTEDEIHGCPSRHGFAEGNRVELELPTAKKAPRAAASGGGAAGVFSLSKGDAATNSSPSSQSCHRRAVEGTAADRAVEEEAQRGRQAMVRAKSYRLDRGTTAVRARREGVERDWAWAGKKLPRIYDRYAMGVVTR